MVALAPRVLRRAPRPGSGPATPRDSPSGAPPRDRDFGGGAENNTRGACATQSPTASFRLSGAEAERWAQRSRRIPWNARQTFGVLRLRSVPTFARDGTPLRMTALLSGKVLPRALLFRQREVVRPGLARFAQGDGERVVIVREFLADLERVERRFHSRILGPAAFLAGHDPRAQLLLDRGRIAHVHLRFRERVELRGETAQLHAHVRPVLVDFRRGGGLLMLRRLRVFSKVHTGLQVGGGVFADGLIVDLQLVS